MAGLVRDRALALFQSLLSGNRHYVPGMSGRLSRWRRRVSILVVREQALRRRSEAHMATVTGFMFQSLLSGNRHYVSRGGCPVSGTGTCGFNPCCPGTGTTSAQGFPDDYIMTGRFQSLL